MRTLTVIAMFTLLTVVSNAQINGFEKGKVLTIPYSQLSISSDSYDFPVLIKTTDTDLKSVSNGGFVENANGYDIIFTRPNNSTRMTHQLVSYDGSTGYIEMWVKLDTIFADQDNYIFMYFGNDTSTVDLSNASAVQNINFDFFYNFDGTDSLTDQSGNGNDAIMTANLSDDGKIGKCAFFDGSGYITPTNTISTRNDLTWTLQMWFKTDSISGPLSMFGDQKWPTQSGPTESPLGWVTDQAAYPDKPFAVATYNGGHEHIISSNTYADNEWHLVTQVGHSDSLFFYVDGVFIGGKPMTYGYNGNPHYVVFGSWTKVSGGDGSNAWTDDISNYYGYLDEIQLYGVSLSEEEVAINYNNQSNPSSFVETGPTAPAELLEEPEALPVEWLEFSGVGKDDVVELIWTTASEIDNHYFQIERMAMDETWSAIGTVKGVGNSVDVNSYRFEDKKPLAGISYYRLKQVDFDDKYNYSKMIMVSFYNSEESRVFPNPVSNELVIQTERIQEISFIDVNGRKVNVPLLQQTKGQAIYDTSKLTQGIYYVLIGYENREMRKIIVSR